MRIDSGLHAHAGDISEFPNIAEWRDQARFAEDAGFGGIWSAEHHFCWDGWGTPTPTNPVMVMAHLSAETSRIRFGQTGVSINDWHPLRVAEDVATLDHMTGGRVDFGFMRGLNNRVAGNFNRAADRRDMKRADAMMWESLDVVLKAWTGKPFRHEGPEYTFPVPGWFDKDTPPDELDPDYFSSEGELIALGVPPTPVQKPHPPVWLMADSVGSHEQAARRGVNVMCWGRSREAMKESWAAYRAADNPAGGQGKLAMMRCVFVAPTMKQAADIMRPAINDLMAHTVGKKNPSWSRKGLLASYEELEPEDHESDWFDFMQRIGWAICGTPEYVRESLQRYEEEAGADHLVMFWSVARLTAKELRGSQDMFAEHVLPHFAQEPMAAEAASA
jgi:alkanesulfonate monooxygenase SsuD/methylene tetrahydromethanopterin reductase-like flavin-dependent oxidoreductase (luciferase family)